MTPSAPIPLDRGLPGGALRTHEEVAAILARTGWKVTGHRVRQIEQAALAKMRFRLRAAGVLDSG